MTDSRGFSPQEAPTSYELAVAASRNEIENKVQLHCEKISSNIKFGILIVATLAAIFGAAVISLMTAPGTSPQWFLLCGTMLAFAVLIGHISKVYSSIDNLRRWTERPWLKSAGPP